MHRHERERPAAHASPVLYVAGLTDAKTLPAFKEDYFHRVYDAFTLYLTWLTLADKATISLPEAFEPLIEAVYGEVDASKLPEFAKETLEAARLDYQAEAQAHEHTAKQKHIVTAQPDSYPSVDGVPPDILGDDDEDPTLHEHYRPTTRLGDPSITVIPLHKRGDKLFLEPTHETEVSLEAKPSWDIAKKLYLNHVKLSRKSLVYELVKRPEKAWQENPLVRYAFPLTFVDGAAEEFRVRFDNELGIVYDKKV